MSEIFKACDMYFTTPQIDTEFKKLNHISCNKIAFLCVCVVSTLITWSLCGDWLVPTVTCVTADNREEKRNYAEQGEEISHECSSKWSTLPNIMLCEKNTAKA